LSAQKDLLSRRLKTRPPSNAVRRCVGLLGRYGITPGHYVRILRQFVEMANQYHTKPTFPVPASVVNHHKKLFRDLRSMDMELAVHGLEHIDYSAIPVDEFHDHIMKAVAIFHEADIPVKGYRFPYLRRNAAYLKVLTDSGLEWDSSEVVSWNSLNPKHYSETGWESYQRILATYDAKDAASTSVLPVCKENLLELPVSVPDDDILVDRLGLEDGQQMRTVWQNMVTLTRKRGELLVMQIHPERYVKVSESLRETLDLVKACGDGWIASMSEITEWWKAKLQFRIEIIKKEQGYRMVNHGPRSATLNVMNAPWNNQKNSVMKVKSWEMYAKHKPVIGIPSDTSKALAGFLQNEGYIWERGASPDQVSCYIDYSGMLDEKGKIRLLRAIKDCGEPILKFNRWPYGAAFAVSITGDIDSVDLWDFWRRFNG